MRRCLVASFFAEVTQQIHSLRARGVMACHSALAVASDSMPVRRSAGSEWIVPPDSAWLGMTDLAGIV